jgi:uncharacterized protein YbjT (DUF2867 family)
MKILVIGGTGLIGRKVVAELRNRDHDVTAASPTSGVNTITGDGLNTAMVATNIVIDVTNPRSREDKAVLKFFETSGRNLFAAERKAGVKHHVVLSIVGTDHLSASGYFRGKIAQEKLIRSSGVPYTIVRSTQFFEFVNGIVKASAKGKTISVPSVLLQPIASDDVANAMADFAVAGPVNGVVEIAGPKRLPMFQLVKQLLVAIGDPREVVADEQILYSGADVQQNTLLPSINARLGSLTFSKWLDTMKLAKSQEK